MSCHADTALDQASVDRGRDGVDPGVLAAVRGAELSLLLRSGKSFYSGGAVVGEFADFFLAGLFAITVSKFIHYRFGGSIDRRKTLDRRDGIHVRSTHCFADSPAPLLLWAVWRLGYDSRGWKYQTLTAWIVVPINYFWRPQFDVNWARGPFFHEQHAVPGLLYLLIYLTLVPLAVYLPTHWMLARWMRRCGSSHSEFSDQSYATDQERAS
jgi:hypothetical protein